MTGQKESIHFIAIGGIGMSALARILLSMGYRVSGSDVKTSYLVEELRKQGADILIGHDAANVPEDCTEIIYSTAIAADNPELLKGREMGIPITHRGDLLARLFNGNRGLAVAGAHGKTTTSGMLGQILHKVDLRPNIVIGGILPLIGSNALKDDSDIWVVEADESDRSFLKLAPYLTVVTNIEPEHMEHYEDDPEVLKKAFSNFCNSSQEIIVCLDNKMVNEIMPSFTGTCHTYGLDHKAVDLTARDIVSNALATTSKVYYKGEFVGELNLSVPGRHNVSNALGAIYAAYIIGVPFRSSMAALMDFSGTGRRFDVLFEDADRHIMVVDDYAHHPTEVAATIAAAKTCGYDRVLAVFQPHRYTRVKELYKEFGAVFGEADVVIMAEIYSAWEERLPEITSALIVDELKSHGVDPVYCHTDGDILAYLQENVGDGDLVLMMGAGDIYKTTEKFCEYLREEKV
ncbi:MAG: UDP-N-acetylmuramate--L-alanine ligase [Bacillota bacterium]|nr:UDP-N-acetylmuramate--L-alanine ligase [Bacillota bacterium]